MKLSFKRAILKSWPYLAIITAHAIWGANFIVAKLTLSEFPIMSLAFLRFFLAVLLLLPFVLTNKKKVKLKKTDFPKFVLVGLFMVTFNIALFYQGLKMTTASEASILTMIIPLLSLLSGWIFLKEKIFTSNLLGVFLGLLGAAIIFGLPLALLGDHLNPEYIIGNILIILACASWVIGASISKSLTERYSTLIITVIIFSVGTLTFAPVAVNEYFLDPNWIYKVSFLGVVGLLYITLASSIAAYFLYEWSVKKIGVLRSDMFQYIEPPIAIGLAVLLIGEKVDVSFLVGAVLIALGVYQGTLAKPHHIHSKAHRH